VPASRKIITPQQTAENLYKIQQESDRFPKNRIADPGNPHHRRGGKPDRSIHESNCQEIGGDVAFDLFRNVNHLTLAAGAGHDFHQALKKNVAGYEEEKQCHQEVLQPMQQPGRLRRFPSQEPELGLQRRATTQKVTGEYVRAPVGAARA